MKTREESIAYQQGYEDGFRLYDERCERLLLQLQDLQRRYDYLLNLRSEELLLQPPKAIIISNKTV